MSKSTQRQAFLKDLTEATQEFKQACASPILDDNAIETLKSVQSRGRFLIRGLQDLIDHAADLEARLKTFDERSLADETIDPSVVGGGA